MDLTLNRNRSIIAENIRAMDAALVEDKDLQRWQIKASTLSKEEEEALYSKYRFKLASTKRSFGVSNAHK